MHGLLIAMLLFAGDTLADDVATRLESAPHDVTAFIERRAGCNHFLGEEAYDPERTVELDRAIRKLRCNRLSRDEQRLRHAYRANSIVLQLLDDTADILGL